MGRMAEQQRKLLEAMMGPEAMGVQVINLDWWSEKVCRNFLFGTCPHLIFGNTKMDLGQCPKTHSDRILKQFQEHVKENPNDPRVQAFKQEHEAAIFGFVEDCDRRIRAAQRKLEKTPEENRKTVDLMKEIGEIELSIQGGTEEIEALGEAGKVEESMEKLAAVDALKALKADKEKELQNLNETAGASGHQKLRVCETCGAMLSVLDSDKRLADHFGGKLHLGYNELRNLLAKFAEERMTGRSTAYPPSLSGPNAAGPPSAASRLPPGGLAPPGPPGSAPHTPLHAPKVPPADEMPVVGHGDKFKREAGELVDDVKEDRYGHGQERRDSRDRDSDRRDRDRYRDDRYDRDRDSRDSREYRDKDRDISRYGDRSDRSDRGDRDRGDRSDRYDRSSRYERDSRDRDRDRRYDDDRKRERSRSPSKRRLV